MGLANTDWDKINGLPMNPFFDAHIVVSKYAGDAREKAGGRKISRIWFAFHELQEAYYRTDGGMGYQNAHDEANKKGINFYRTNPKWNQSIFYPYEKFKRLPSKN